MRHFFPTMAQKIHVLLILLLLFLSYILVCSANVKRERDLKRWISWNVKNHNKKQAYLRAGSVDRESSTRWDPKLRVAEMNKIQISVSQDGTGDFKTIKEAIDSIALHNTRRVVLDIKPGVYRYIFIIPFCQSI